MLSTARRLGPLLAASVALLGVAGPTVAHADTTTSSPVPAPSVMGWFEGRWIRLADGWGEAQACTSDNLQTARCYRSVEEMEAAETSASEASSSTAIALACTRSVFLYRSTGMSGGSLHLTVGGLIDLAPYGFDNDTSSYSIGGCASKFYDTNGGSTQYPGNTGAGASASSMLSGWDNRVSSVFIS